MRILRLHFPKADRPIVEPLSRMATALGLSKAEARALIVQWELDGDLVRRSDGGFDVIVHRRRDPGRCDCGARHAPLEPLRPAIAVQVALGEPRPLDPPARPVRPRR